MTKDTSQQPAQPFLIGEDLSALGRISLGAALPIFAKTNIPTALAPTTLLSAQTEGFGTVESQSLLTWLPELFAHWQRQNINLSGALVGYLGSEALINLFEAYLSQQNLPIVLIDPVMGDSGKLYPNINAANVTAMSALIQTATVITPNLTEAQFLTGRPGTTTVTTAELQAIFHDLTLLTHNKAQIVITGIPYEAQILTVWQKGSQLQQLQQPKLSGHFYGSGDTFAAILACQLYAKVPFDQAVKRACDLTYVALKQTADSHIQRRFGLQLSALLTQL